MPVLTLFAENIWTMAGDDVRMYGIPFSTRMTIVRLANGGLWLHSPVAPTDARIEAVNALGTVAQIVAPNKIHSLGVEKWKQIFPSAKSWVSPEFEHRHPDIPADGVLGDAAPSDWSADIDQHVFGGSIFLDEVVFLHRPSGTLIVTDLIQRHAADRQSWFWKMVKGWAGVLGDGGTARDLRASFRDRDTARRSRDRILDWGFDKLIISHGACMSGGAKSYVGEALAWLD